MLAIPLGLRHFLFVYKSKLLFHFFLRIVFDCSIYLLFYTYYLIYSMNSNYLKEILTSEGSHLSNISYKISELMNHINILKNKVKAIVEHSSFQFPPLVKENENLKLKSSNLLKEMTAIQKLIDGEIKTELSDCTEELQHLSSSLREVKLLLEILEELIELNTLVKDARYKLERNEFYDCAELVISMQILIKNNSEKLKLVEIFKTLSQEVVLTYEQLIHQICEIWSQSVNINVINKSEKNITEINITVNIKSYSAITQILKASDLLKSNLIEKKFSLTLLNEIFKNVILKKCSINSKDGDDDVNDRAVLIIEVFNNYNKPNYLDVFSNIKTIIEFLKKHLHIQIQNNVNFLSKIGSHIANDFADCLIKNCLSETIPTSSDDLDKYKIVVENTEVFEKILQESGFLSGDASSLLDYAKNINVLFANKFCQSYLHKARVIMKKDLHNVIKSEDIISYISIFPLNVKNMLREKFSIQEEVFLFPRCQVSKQAEEIITLVYSIMKEIQKSLDLCAVRLFFTIRNIFEMYSAVVPLHHKKFLETLPHQVALFHNNCMYFTHNLINISSEHYNNIPSVLKDHFTILIEEAIALRSLAAETLEVTVTNQKQQLIYILRDSGFALLNENPKLDPNSEKSIRQCFRQLQILQTVWSDVLPLNVYNRAIGFLLDAVIEELINLIISVEDISSQTASDLASCFTVILDKAPSLFPESKEIYRHSRKWQKFKELVIVLKGSLRDIDDRWANGMGPLAVEFSPEQVRHLIRALFQNSERRAALLLRIR